MRERLFRVVREAVISVPDRAKARALYLEIEECLRFFEAISVHSNRIDVGLIKKGRKHEYFFEETIPSSAASFPYKERFETREGRIIRTRTSLDNAVFTSRTGISDSELRRVTQRIQNITKGK